MISRHLDANQATNVDRKNTYGECYFVGNYLIAWMSNKQNFISLFTPEVEYIAIGSRCTRLLQMKQMLSEYGIDHIDKHVISLEYVSIENQLVDIMTKPLYSLRFKSLRKYLGICSIDLDQLFSVSHTYDPRPVNYLLIA